MRTKGSASSLGVGDLIWEGGAGLTGGETREFYSGGCIWDGSVAGLAYVSCRRELGYPYWAFGSRD